MVSLQREISLCSSLALSPSPVDHMVSLFSVFLGSVVIKIVILSEDGRANLKVLLEGSQV
ncbi:hypothetical protein TorRG33x02_267510 [Trema orientale]|uniref:Uncharacterized protein n=1 Tax=Trema orientale TaxID=63057 RepID=A0A2P5CZX5_TREOI|nr:hypothetical protein TorRG33x02_267510 [Trema orientale]